MIINSITIFRHAAPMENAGLGQCRPDDIKADDDEYEAYRKRMMLAYRFRPNPLVSLNIFLIFTKNFYISLFKNVRKKMIFEASKLKVGTRKKL